MLQYNTPNGLYTLRRKDSCTSPLVSAIWDLLPSVTMKHKSNHYDVEELIDFMKGTITVDLPQLLHFLDIPATRASHLDALAGDSVEPPISFNMSDGSIIKCNSGLRRRFQLIDDYFTEYPDRNEMDIPFSCTVFLDSIYGLASDKLTTCYHCLAYLNPKSNVYPFYFNPKGITLPALTHLVSRLTEEERVALEQYGDRMGIKLPRKDGIAILGVLDTYRADLNVMALLFPNHPSYVWCSVVDNHANKHHALFPYVDSLLNWDFSLDRDEFFFETDKVIELVERVIREANGTDMDVGSIRKLACFITEPTEVMGPYDVDITLSDRAEENRRIFAHMLKGDNKVLIALKHELLSI